jgi:hypothetical protein
MKQVVLFISMLAMATYSQAQRDFRTAYLKVRIDNKGYITSMVNEAKGSPSYHREFSPENHPSPLMSLLKKSWGVKDGKAVVSYSYSFPVKAEFNDTKKQILLTYQEGEKATVSISTKSKYIRLQLTSLTNYDKQRVHSIVWGSYNTSIYNLFGEVIGVARDTSASVNYAIGVLACDFVSRPGIPIQVSPVQGEGYIIHTPDAKSHPLPEGLYEGQFFPDCGAGGRDWDFYCHPEIYYRGVRGFTAAYIDTGYHGIYITYHCRNSQIADTAYQANSPGYPGDRFRRWVSYPEENGNTNFIGSTIALYGTPDDKALNTLENIVVSEKMPHITDERNVWIRKPSSARMDMFWYGDCDSAFSYAEQWGNHPGIQHEGIYNQLFYPNPATNQLEQKVIPLSTGKLSPSDFIKQYGKPNITFGPHTLSLYLNNKKQTDVNPYASDELAYCYKVALTKSINKTDSVLEVSDTTFLGLSDLGSVAGPDRDNINYFRLGNEIIATSTPVSASYPYSLVHVARGQYGTEVASHNTGDTLYKLLRNCYKGFFPNSNLAINKYADYYGQAVSKWGGYVDWDGGPAGCSLNYPYDVMTYLTKVHATAARLGYPAVRSMSGGFAYESWFFITAQNNGYLCNPNGLTLNNPGHNGSEGINFLTQYYSNYYTVSLHGPGIADFKSANMLEQFMRFVAGWDASAGIGMSQKAVEGLGNEKKQQYFAIIRKWENARRYSVIPNDIKLMMRDLNNNFLLEQVNNNTWNLYKADKDGNNKQFYRTLKSKQV